MPIVVCSSRGPRFPAWDSPEKRNHGCLGAICDHCKKEADEIVHYAKFREIAWAPMGWIRADDGSVFCDTCYIYGMAVCVQNGIEWIDGYDLNKAKDFVDGK
jgi:hypothetical protein